MYNNAARVHQPPAHSESLYCSGENKADRRKFAPQAARGAQTKRSLGRQMRECAILPLAVRFLLNAAGEETRLTALRCKVTVILLISAEQILQTHIIYSKRGAQNWVLYFLSYHFLF